MKNPFFSVPTVSFILGLVILFPTSIDAGRQKSPHSLKRKQEKTQQEIRKKIERHVETMFYSSQDRKYVLDEICHDAALFINNYCYKAFWKSDLAQNLLEKTLDNFIINDQKSHFYEALNTFIGNLWNQRGRSKYSRKEVECKTIRFISEVLVNYCLPKKTIKYKYKTHKNLTQTFLQPIVILD
ncbi:MAG: hypothetical protein V1855_00380 [bacterium]